jgi:hypothetical protein
LNFREHASDDLADTSSSDLIARLLVDGTSSPGAVHAAAFSVGDLVDEPEAQVSPQNTAQTLHPSDESQQAELSSKLEAKRDNDIWAIVQEKKANLRCPVPSKRIKRREI